MASSASCRVGSPNADVAGLGVFIAFALQAGLSIFVSVLGFVLDLRWDLRYRSLEDPQPDEDVLQVCVGNPPKEVRQKKQLRLAQRMNATISEFQTINGIALLVAALQQRDSLSLYHKRIVYDIVSLTGVSFTISLLALWLLDQTTEDQKSLIDKMLERDEERIGFFKMISVFLSREMMTALFVILYTVYAIYFGRALRQWSEVESGHCYLYNGIARPDSAHPDVDIAYVASTASVTISLLIICSLLGAPAAIAKAHIFLLFGLFARLGGGVITQTTQVYRTVSFILWNLRIAAIVVANLQFPLHIYMVATVRQSNLHYLEGESENSWGFGQVVAIALLFPTFRSCFYEYRVYQADMRHWEKEKSSGAE